MLDRTGIASGKFRIARGLGRNHAWVMALKPCEECGEPVSTKAISCPHCGFKMKHVPGALDIPLGGRLLKMFFIALVICAIIGVLVAIANH